MDVQIHANETETVLEALRAYKDQLKREITVIPDISGGSYVERLQVKRETLTRVIDRINDL